MNPAVTAPTTGASGDRSEATRNLLSRLAATPPAFPTSVRIAISVVEAINDADCSLETVTRLMQTEPLLAAKVVAVANSVAYSSGGRPITSIREAVRRVGLATLKSLAVSIVMRQMAAGAAGGRGPAAARLWDHSLHVAVLAFVIARRLTRQSAEAAMFAGIIHELGGFYLLSMSRETLGIDDAALARCASSDDGRDPYDDNDGTETPMARIGRPLLAAMHIPEPIVEAVAATWRGFIALPPETLGDTLMLADVLAPVRSPFENTFGEQAGADHSEIDLVAGRDTLAGLLQESDQVIRSLLGALRA
ncbi:MAG: HDOD domain-containing protein [Lautropia sp.]